MVAAGSKPPFEVAAKLWSAANQAAPYMVARGGVNDGVDVSLAIYHLND
jgi:hypothetical protein